MIVNTDVPIKLHVTHSNTSQRLAEQRFYTKMTIFEIKEIVSRKFGTSSDYVKLNLHQKSGQVLSLADENKTISDYYAEDFDTIHVIDSNPNSVLVKHNLDDLSNVQKYEISEEDYDKRDDTVRKFKAKLVSDPNYQQFLKENQAETFEQEATLITVNSRCLLGDGFRRGTVKYVGKIPELGTGFWVGVQLDEPMGDCDGKAKGKFYFECSDKFGTFVRPDYVKVGDFPPEDLFNPDEDEI